MSPPPLAKIIQTLKERLTCPCLTKLITKRDPSVRTLETLPAGTAGNAVTGPAGTAGNTITGPAGTAGNVVTGIRAAAKI